MTPEVEALVEFFKKRSKDKFSLSEVLEESDFYPIFTRAFHFKPKKRETSTLLFEILDQLEIEGIIQQERIEGITYYSLREDQEVSMGERALS